MPKTTNRLSQYNALQSFSRTTNLPIPLKGDIGQVDSWKITASGLVSTVELTLVTPLAPEYSGEYRVSVSDLSQSDTEIAFINATTTESSDVISGLSGMEASEHVGWSLYGNGIPEGSVITEVTNATTVKISENATITQAGTAFLRISPYPFTGTDPSVVGLNQEYIATISGSSVTFTTELEWSFLEDLSEPDFSSLQTSAKVTPLYNHQWMATQGTNAISVVSDIYDHKSRYSLKVQPSGSGPVTLVLDSVNSMFIGDNGKDFSFNAKIYCNQLSSVECLLSHSESISPEPVSTNVYPGRFTAVRSNVEELPISNEESYSLNVSITVSGHGGQPFYITSPHLIEDFLYHSNPYVYSAKRSMPNFYWYIDSSQVNPSSPMHRLMDCMMTGARDVYEEYLRIYVYEPGQLGVLSEQIETNNVHSTLVNPDYVNPRYAPWLSQFNGHRLKKNIQYTVNGITNTTYTEPQPLFESIGAKEAFIKWQLKNGYYGRAAGTMEALKESVKQVLHYTKDSSQSTYFVSVTPRYQSDPFKILVRTLVNETFDCTEEGQESSAILDAIELAKPMGYKVYHQAVENLEFRIGDNLGTYPLGDTVD